MSQPDDQSITIGVVMARSGNGSILRIGHLLIRQLQILAPLWTAAQPGIAADRFAREIVRF